MTISRSPAAETGAGRENVRPAFGRWPGRPKNFSGENAGTITVSPGCGENTQWRARRPKYYAT
jgi:hypothetical protein